MTIEQRVRQVASDVLNVPADELKADASPESIASWDSVQHLNLVLALEQELGVQISPEEIERMRSFGEIVRLMEEKKPA